MTNDQDGSIFNGSTPAPDQEQVASNQSEVKSTEAPQTDAYADLLKGITTEDGRAKYATVSDALNSIPHAQTHISQLEAELAELKAQAKERQAAEEASRLENEQVQKEAVFGQDQVAELVNQTLSQREQQQLQQKNVTSVVTAMTEKFGSQEAADKAYRDKAAEMGISLDMMNSLAMTSPKAVLSYFGATGASAPTMTEGSLNTASMSQPAQTPKGDNPLLTGSMKDMQAEWDRIKKDLGL